MNSPPPRSSRNQAGSSPGKASSTGRPPRFPDVSLADEQLEGADIIARSEHTISRRDIDSDALRILYRLHRNGYRAYLVGGSVRDLWVGKKPKDFDIVTDARPRRIRRLFRNCRIIGRRFRLAHLYFGNEKIIEVATFRSSPEDDETVKDGDLIRRDNVFGTPAEDARRRDLTINGLFYSIADFSVIDFVGGVEDLKQGVVRTIQDPKKSFREDPVRMLRTIRHATRLDFEIDRRTKAALKSEREEILKSNASRLLEELYKDLASGSAAAFFDELCEFRFLATLIPELERSFKGSGREIFRRSLQRLDELHDSGQPISHSVGLSALFSPLILPAARKLERLKQPSVGQCMSAFEKQLKPALTHLKIYRKDADRLWHILGSWPRLKASYEKETISKSLLKRQYFPDAARVFGLLEDPDPNLQKFVDRAIRQAQEVAPEPEPRKKKKKKSSKKRSKRGSRGKQ